MPARLDTSSELEDERLMTMTIFVMCGVVIFLQVIIGCALADFVVAVFHWFEDNFLLVKKYRWRAIEELAKNNAVHHARPRDILKYSV